MGGDESKMKKKKSFREYNLYNFIAEWLMGKDKENRVLISPDVPSIPTSSRLGIQTIAPDLAVYKKNSSEKLTLIEVKADSMYLIEGIGRCEVYKLIADFVYLALPESIAKKIGSNSFYEYWHIGILSVSEKGDIEEIVEAKQNDIYKVFGLRSTLLENIKSALRVK